MSATISAPASPRTPQSLLATLGARPTDERLVAAATAVVAAAVASGRRYPRKVAAAILRESCPGHLVASYRQRLVAGVRDLLPDALDGHPDAGTADVAPGGLPLAGAWSGWLSVREYVRATGETSQTLYRQLRDPWHRRRLGYPRWTGSEWRLARALLDPAATLALQAALPPREPCPELLPPDCRREPAAGPPAAPEKAPDAGRFAGDASRTPPKHTDAQLPG